MAAVRLNIHNPDAVVFVMDKRAVLQIAFEKPENAVQTIARKTEHTGKPLFGCAWLLENNCENSLFKIHTYTNSASLFSFLV
jgi:hypothetical protein